ncbi:MAG: glycosyltransferase [Anaerolineae bacterium]|nr:glycosyltransferase [Anaerolineae bacterium]MDW8173753.1 glycosyltransferase [Anaerolineae bacterium]
MIVHLTPYYAPAYAFGGVPRAVEGLARAQVEQGEVVRILTTDAFSRDGGRASPPQEWRDGVLVRRCPNHWPLLRRWNLSSAWVSRALNTWLEEGARIVHLHEFRTLEALQAAQVARPIVPLVVSPHGTLAAHTGRSALKRAWDSLLSPYVARRVRAVVALHEQEAQDAHALWQRFGLSPKCFVVPNGVRWQDFTNLPDPAPLCHRLGLEGQRVLLFMGRLQARKGVLPLARAFLRVAPSDWALLLVGPDEDQGAALKPLLKPGRLVWAGYLEGEARLQAFACAKAFALVARGEGLPMAALEALACGLPCLLSSECHLPDVESSGSGLIVPPDDEDALAQAMQALLSESADRHAARRAAAQQLVRQRYSWEAVAQAMCAVYNQL